MIKIQKIIDEKLIDSINPQLKENVFVGIFEKDKLVEYSAYVLTDDYMLINLFSNNSNDEYLHDAMFKTLFYYADTEKVRYMKSAINLEKFGFEKVNGEYILDLYNQFDKMCKCRKDI